MSTIAITIPVTDGHAGATLRRLAHQIEKAAAVLPDASGAATILTIDNAPAAGAGPTATVQVTGPYTSALFGV